MPSARPPLRARKLRDLDLARVDGREPAFLSAASGLVRSGGELYVVADDELHLGRFEPEGGAPGSLMRLLDGKLPERPAARKRRKADLEILMRLPALPGFAHGALLALGSGSRPPRERGALVQLDEDGRARGMAAGSMPRRCIDSWRASSARRTSRGRGWMGLGCGCCSVATTAVE
jgi:hypothetical protein